ncbi:helix-turn-helix domain-containing protein [Eggerthella sp.]
MSQKELAEAAGLTPASVSRNVNGERLPWPATIAAA